MNDEYEIDEEELTDEKRRELMLKFREIYETAKTASARKEADISLCGITEGLDDHNRLIADWNHACMCDLCRSYA